MKVKIKKLSENSTIPSYAKQGDAGLDLIAISEEYDDYGNLVFGTGLSIEIPEGYVGLIFPRSSISNYAIRMSNSVGVIDSGYQGEIIFKFKPTMVFPDRKQESHFRYNIGNKIGQLIILRYLQIELVESETLSETERNKDGFGSSGK